MDRMELRSSRLVGLLVIIVAALAAPVKETGAAATGFDTVLSLRESCDDVAVRRELEPLLASITLPEPQAGATG